MKATQLSKVVKLMQSNPTIKPQEMAKKLGLTISQVYVLRNQAKKKLVANTTMPKVEKIKFDKDRYILALETEVHELNKKILEAKNNHDALDAEYTQAKIMYLDALAVIKYLEGKVK